MATMAADSGGSSAVLKIQINVKGQQDRQVVRKSTSKGFEVVEVGGMVFYRKRKTPVVVEQLQASPSKRQQSEPDQPAGAAAGAAPAQHMDLEGNNGEALYAAGDADVYQEEGHFAADGSPPMQDILLSAEQHGTAAGADAPLEDIRDQLVQCLPSSCPKVIAVQFALEKLLTHGAAQLDRSNGTGIYSQSARQVLHGFTDLLQQRADAAQAMLLQVRPRAAATASSSSGSMRLGQPAQAPQVPGQGQAGLQDTPMQAGPAIADRVTPGASSTPAGATPQADGAVAAEARDDPLEQYLQQAPMVRELCSGVALRAQLQQQLAALQEEAAAWAVIRRKHCAGQGQEQGQEQGHGARKELHQGRQGQGQGETAGNDGAAAAENRPSEGSTAAAAQLDGPSLLSSTEATVNAALKLQVESLTAFLTKVDALVAQGEQACTMLQADYHQDKFKTFPHVNSPAWLIRQIISKHQAAAADEPAAQ